MTTQFTPKGDWDLRGKGGYIDGIALVVHARPTWDNGDISFIWTLLGDLVCIYLSCCLENEKTEGGGLHYVLKRIV